MTDEPVKLCALCRLPRTMQGSRLIEIDGYKRWVHVHCATNSKEPKQMNNEPAFAFTEMHTHGSPYTQWKGMTLRDYFAAKALPIAWHAYDEGYTGQPECVEQSIAHHAYQIADAMMEARK